MVLHRESGSARDKQPQGGNLISMQGLQTWLRAKYNLTKPRIDKKKNSSKYKIQGLQQDRISNSKK